MAASSMPATPASTACPARPHPSPSYSRTPPAPPAARCCRPATTVDDDRRRRRHLDRQRHAMRRHGRRRFRPHRHGNPGRAQRQCRPEGAHRGDPAQGRAIDESRRRRGKIRAEDDARQRRRKPAARSPPAPSSPMSATRRSAFSAPSASPPPACSKTARRRRSRSLQRARDMLISIEHPTGEFTVTASLDDDGNLAEAGVLRTARKLFDGLVYD